MAVLSDLVLRLRANSADLQLGLDKAKSAMKDAGKASSELNKNIKSAMKDAGKASSELNKNIKSAFDYAEKAIDNVIPGFSNFTSVLGKVLSAVTNLLGGLKKLKVAFASTGIGLLVVALGSLISYFKNTEEGADKFSIALGRIKAVISVVMQRINMLGEAVALFFQGKFKKAGAKAEEAFTDLGDAIKDADKAGNEAGIRRDKLEDKEIAFITRRQELENKIAKAREIYSNKENSIADQNKAINEAMAASNELYSTQTALAQENLDILKLENSTKERTNDRIKEEKEAEAAILAIQAEKSNELRALYRMQGQIVEQTEKEIEEREKALETLKKENQLEFVVVPKLKEPDVNISDKLKSDSKLQSVDIYTKEEQIIGPATLFEETWKTATDSVREMLSNTAISSQHLFESLVDSISNALGNLSEVLKAGANSFKEYAQNVRQAVKVIIGSLIADGVTAAVTNALKTTALTPWLIPVVAGAAAGLAKTAFNTLIPKFATGTIYAPGGLALVGERGPELVNIPRGSQVYSNSLSRSMIGNQQLVARVSGQDLLFILTEAERVKNNSY